MASQSKRVISLVLGGGRGTRLYPLTKYRAKPAVPIAGKYRLIDIPLSNCINSGLNQVYVLTQFLSVSLHRHIRQTYRFDNFSGGFVEVLAAQQTMEEGTDWYQGTADAVRKNLRYIEHSDIDYVLILSGDQLYRMDYGEMIATHEKSGADVTIAGMPVSREAVGGLGVMRLDAKGRVEGFLEKPQTAEEVDSLVMEPEWIEAQGVACQGRECVASMGIYLFNRDMLFDVLTKTSYEDFGKEIFPASVRSSHVQLHLTDGYWEDIGTIGAFFEANIALTRKNPPFDMAVAESPIFTRARYLPPSSMQGATITSSFIAEGCRIGKGAVIENSVIGQRCEIGENVTIRNSIIMGADFYESCDEKAEDGKRGEPCIGIEDGCIIEGAIVDKNCRIGKNVRIVNDQNIKDSPDDDDAVCVVRDGIPVIMKDATLPDGWKL